MSERAVVTEATAGTELADETAPLDVPPRSTRSSSSTTAASTRS